MKDSRIVVMKGVDQHGQPVEEVLDMEQPAVKRLVAFLEQRAAEIEAEAAEADGMGALLAKKAAEAGFGDGEQVRIDEPDEPN
jgi:hypothetical protein